MDPHIRIRSASYVSGPGRSSEPVRPPATGRRSGVIATLLVVVAGSTVVALAAEVLSTLT